MPPATRIWRVRVLLCAVATTAAAAQIPSRAPKPRAGKAVAIWQEEVGVRPGTAVKPRHVFARNDTTVPIAITTLRFTKRRNLRIACEPLELTRMVLAPRGVHSVLEVLPAEAGRQHDFEVAADWRVASECIGRDAPGVADAPDDADRRVTTRAITMLPEYSPRLRGTAFAVDFFVSAAGLVDSVHINGLTDRRYAAKVREVLMRYVFTGATVRGCPVPATTRQWFTLGQGAR